jgi:hypothetical protein
MGSSGGGGSELQASDEKDEGVTAQMIDSSTRSYSTIGYTGLDQNLVGQLINLGCTRQ